MMYFESMNKQQYIERYGEAKYAEFLAKQKARRSTTESKKARAEYMRKYYASKNGGVVRATKKRGLEGVADGSYWQKYFQQDDVKAANRERAKAKYQSMSQQERKENRAKQYAARKAKLASDPTFAAEQAAKQQKRFDRWNEAHPGLHRERGAAWDKANPHYKRANKHARRALGKINPAFVKFLRSKPCADCGTTEKQITIGHLIPVARNGTNHPCNLIAQCRSCNSKQNKRIHPRFAMAHYPEAARYAVA